MYTCIHVCLVGTYAQATLHQELSMDLGWKGYRAAADPGFLEGGV